MATDECEDSWCREPKDDMATEFQKAGFVGSGNTISSVEIITFTVDINGWSDEFPCVHNNPTWIHLKACSRSLQVSIIVGSIMSTIFPRIYNPHACIKLI